MDNSHISSHSGPVLLTVGDWTNPDRRRRIIASLVEDVYRREYNRLGKPHHAPRRSNLNHEPQADLDNWGDFFDESQADRAPRWRDLFHEPQDDSVLIKDNGVVIGAIYEYKFPPNPNLPIYVIAFRGIIKKLPTKLEGDLKSIVQLTLGGDLKSAVQLIFNELERSSRLQLAMDTVQKIMDASAGDPNCVWLAGHSLGSAIALYVGKKMAKKGFLLNNTYLFNPPFIDVPVEHIKDGKQIKKWLPVGLSFFKAGVAGVVGPDCAVQGVHHQHSDPFAGLYNWFPHLFVNQDDFICSGYITYFRTREFMKRIGAGEIERIAGKISITSLFSTDSEPLHLLPSAHLTINTGPNPTGYRRAHRIDQWWDPSFMGESETIEYR